MSSGLWSAPLRSLVAPFSFVMCAESAIQMKQQLKNARIGVRNTQAVTWLLRGKRFIAQARNPPRTS